MSEHSKKKNKGSVVSIIIICIAAAVIAFCLYNIISYFVESDQEQSRYSYIASEFENKENVTGTDTALDADEVEGSFREGYYHDEKYIYDPELHDYFDYFANIDFAKLKAEYPDVEAWIYIPGTKISYPVLSSHGNNYLYKNYLGVQDTPQA